MRILGIETSCDETAAAVVEDGVKIISNVVASSVEIHAKYGGIIPDQAAREQVKAIIPVIQEAVSIERLAVRDIDAIAVTVGPGLIGSLLVGVETAKALAFAWNKPLVPVNHLVGHIYANWLKEDSIASLQNDEPQFPALVLLVSGGHSELILMTNHRKFKYLGGTRDDAAGECLDKCARILGLGYPGGVAIEKAAIKNSNYKLPRPMINDRSLDFSFSGLKTAVKNLVNPNPCECAYELQEAIADVLVFKTLKAAEKYKVKNILLAGGVAANKRLREKLPQALCPPINLCTDNAACIASAAFFNYHPIPWQKVDADPSLDIS